MTSNGGRIVGVFGLRGECKIDATRVGADALVAGAAIGMLLPNGSRRRLVVRAARLHQGRPLAAFEGVDDITAAEKLVGGVLEIERSEIVLKPGEYLDADLVGCRLVAKHAAEIGTVVAVEHYPAQDMLVVGSRRTLVPLVSAFIRTIDIDTKSIHVTLPLGLLDENDAERA